MCFGWHQCVLDTAEQCLHNVSPLLFLMVLRQWAGGECTKYWEGTQLDSWSQLTKTTFHVEWHHAQHIQLRGRKKEKRHGHLELQYLSSQAIITCGETLLSQRQLNVCLLELCLHTQFLLHLPHCLCLNPQVLSLLPFQLSPHATVGDWARLAVWLSFLRGQTHNNSSNALAV